MAYSKYHRMLAALAYKRTGYRADAAVPEFLQYCKDLQLELPPSARAAESFISYWAPDWVGLCSIDGKAGCSGRKRKLDTPKLQQIFDELMGWEAAGKAGPYRSIDELIENSTVVSEIVRTANVSIDTVITRLREEFPNLAYMKLGIKPKHSEAQLQDRYESCSIKLEEQPELRERVIFIDAKTMYMKMGTRFGWVDRSKEDTFRTVFPASLKNPIVLKYYIAVNYRLGALLLMFYTGTTGMPADRDPAKPYLVSDSCCSSPLL